MDTSLFGWEGLSPPPNWAVTSNGGAFLGTTCKLGLGKGERSVLALLVEECFFVKMLFQFELVEV